MATDTPTQSTHRERNLKAPCARVGDFVTYDGTPDAIGVAAARFHPLKRGVWEYDFQQGALDDLLATNDVSAAGSPTLGFVSGDAAGVYQLKHDAQDEAQRLTLYMGDNKQFDVSKNLVFMARVKVDAAAIPWSADQRFVVGLADDLNATLDSITAHAWFRMEGASANLLWETDDGTTDDDDNDTGVDVADDTWLDLAIDLRDTSAVKFYVDGAYVGEGDISAHSGNLQVYMEIQKDGGTEADALEVDYLRVEFDR